MQLYLFLEPKTIIIKQHLSRPIRFVPCREFNHEFSICLHLHSVCVCLCIIARTNAMLPAGIQNNSCLHASIFTMLLSFPILISYSLLFFLSLFLSLSLSDWLRFNSIKLYRVELTPILSLNWIVNWRYPTPGADYVVAILSSNLFAAKIQ